MLAIPLWLAWLLAVAVLPFHAHHHVVPVAAWVAPLFLLRWSRRSHSGGRAWLGVVAAIALGDWLAFQGGYFQFPALVLPAIALASGLRVVDVSDPLAPTTVGGVYLPGTSARVAVSGSRACVAAGGGGLHVLDVSDPTSPRPFGVYPTSAEARGVALSRDGRFAYVANAGDGLLVLDLADPAGPEDPAPPTSMACPAASSPRATGRFRVRSKRDDAA